MNNQRILIVDGDQYETRVLKRTMRMNGFEVKSVLNPEAAMVSAASRSPDFIVTEQEFPSASGLAYIGSLRAISPAARILVLTSYASVEKAVASIKLGAWNYMAKPAYANEILAGLGIDLEEIPEKSSNSGLRETHSLGDYEWNHILWALQENAGNVSATARALRMSRRTLQRKIESWRVKDGKSTTPGRRVTESGDPNGRRPCARPNASRQSAGVVGHCDGPQAGRT